ncbi:type II toxin-antitoxin system PemK/MazF family toxin [Psychroflexus planctonicus]|uniref:type II toxin-antitoxin system PemK/MazF family toxin n=1 Tax=Psychroflexus planctonicus TaxID=1526575 RepID=UPI0035716F0D
MVVYRITSKIHTSPFDIYIDEWEESGLKLPSVVRIHKLATLEKDMIELVLGNVDYSLKRRIREKLTMLPV